MSKVIPHLGPIKTQAEAEADGRAGIPIATHQMNPEGTRKEVRIDIESRPLVPIVFIPGVMGTRIEASDPRGDRFLWDTDSSVGMWKHYLFGAPPSFEDGTDPQIEAVATRFAAPGKLMWTLDSGNTKAEMRSIRDALINPDAKDEAAIKARIDIEMRRRQARGWYSLFYESYVPLLHALSCWGRGYPVRHAGADGQLHTYRNGKVYHPVWAFGYDWRRSPDLIANGGVPYALGEEFRTFLGKVMGDDYGDCNKWHWPACKQVIVVTHSLGGLVGRYLSEVAGFNPQIAAVVHLAQPTTGAAVACLRFMMGTEPEANAGLGGNEDGILRHIMGVSPQRYLSEVAQLAGPQILLPSNDYSADPAKPVAEPGAPIDWVRWDDSQGLHKNFITPREIATARGDTGLPSPLYRHPRIGWSAPRYWRRWEFGSASGYTEILRPDQVHWFHEKEVGRADATRVKSGAAPSSNPAESDSAVQTKLNDIKRAYTQADAVITSLRLKHHPKTLVIYGNAHPTITRLVVGLAPVKEQSGQVDPKTFLPTPKNPLTTYRLAWGFDTQAPGDGTVPESSGGALGALGVPKVAPIAGQSSGHQDITGSAQARVELLDHLQSLLKEFS